LAAISGAILIGMRISRISRLDLHFHIDMVAVNDTGIGRQAVPVTYESLV